MASPRKASGLHSRKRPPSDYNLSDFDNQFELCRVTGYSHDTVLALIATAQPITRRGATRALKIRPIWLYSDNGYFAMWVQWLKMFIPQWEERFRKVVKDIALLPNPQQIIETAAVALKIDPEQLIYYSEHADEIDTFLDTQRAMLVRIAKVKLWELIASGDAATIRWALPRIAPEEFGDTEKGKPGDHQTINVIEVDGAI